MGHLDEDDRLAGCSLRVSGGWVRGVLDFSGRARELPGLHRVQWPAGLPDGVRSQPNGGAEDGHDQCLRPIGQRGDRFGAVREYTAGIGNLALDFAQV